MATTYTSSLRLTDQETGGNANTWGTVADTNFKHIDDAIAGMYFVDAEGATEEGLTANQGADDTSRYACLKITGAPTGGSFICSLPAVEKAYYVFTSITDGTATIRTGGAGGVAFTSLDPNGVIYCDGVSVYLIANINTSTTDLIAANNLSDLTDSEAAVSNLFAQRPWAASASSLGWGLSVCATDNELEVKQTTVLSAVYPVGSIYMNRTNSTNPGTIFGFGTWVAVASARVLIGVGTDTDDNAASYTVTAESARGVYEHQLTEAEMPSHSHDYIYRDQNVTSDNNGGVGVRTLKTVNATTDPAGGDQPHDNVQPWFSVYIWERTA